jgi:hypothetical protein
VPAQKCTKDLEEDTGADVGYSGMDHRHIYIDLEEEDLFHVDFFGIMTGIMYQITIMIMIITITGGHQ